MKINQLGRSMVEMLGVLAIIGVLSVGAISGYSNAMTKHKLNKQTEQIGFIMDNVHINLDAIKRSKAETGQDIINLLKAMQIIPNEMIKDNTKFIYDVYNNRIYIQNHSGGGNFYFEFKMNVGKNKDSCINLIQIGKLRSKLLWRIRIEASKNYYMAGDSYCTSSEKCLKDMTLPEMEEYCNTCVNSASCVFTFQDIL